MVKVVVKDALGAGIEIFSGSVWSDRFDTLNKSGVRKVWLDEDNFRQSTLFNAGSYKLITDFHKVRGSVMELDSITGRKGGELLFSVTGISFRFDSSKAFRPDATVFKGNDLIIGNNFADNVRLGLGRDRFIGNAGSDEAWGQGGDDTLDGGTGVDFLLGGDGNDSLLGGTDFDVLIGGAGSDKIYGGDGGDNIDGEAGRDFLNGGAGQDTFLFTKASHSGVGANRRDVIQDFDDSDRIDLTEAATGLVFSESGEIAKGIWVVKEDGFQIVNIDVTGDAVADMQIAVEGAQIVADSFKLD